MLPIIFHPIYSQLALPARHRFPIQKYQRLFDRVVSQYREHITIFEVEKPVTLEQLQSVHEPNYISHFLNGTLSDKEMKRIGFTWSEQFLKRTLTAVGGTIQTAKLAHKHGLAINLTGGYHHAHPDFGSGFCVFNDLAIAANIMLSKGLANRVLIFDCDVHQGDGTATCCEDNNDIYTLSIHCEKNFPARKTNSDWDIGLNKHLTDDTYLETIKQAFTAAINSFKPDFIIYDAGVDIHENDDLGLLNISTNGVHQRDLFVLQLTHDVKIPTMAVIGGGYQRNIDALTDVHIQLVNAAIKVRN